MRYGFIGCGNMGGALACALAAKTQDILLANRTLQKAQDLAATLGAGVTTGSNLDVVQQCDIIFLGIKPQMYEEVLDSLAPSLKQQKPLLVSMAAGISIAKVEELVGCALPIIRIMPNTPVKVGEGLILYCTNSLVEQQTLQQFLEDMEQAGTFDLVPEELINAGCALSGCGPAFVYLFLEALASGGEACGLSPQKAREYACHTLRGAAALALAEDVSLQELKQNVCSPGGATIKGVKILEEGDFCQLATASVVAAYERSCQLGS